MNKKNITNIMLRNLFSCSYEDVEYIIDILNKIENTQFQINGKLMFLFPKRGEFTELLTEQYNVMSDLNSKDAHPSTKFEMIFYSILDIISHVLESRYELAIERDPEKIFDIRIDGAKSYFSFKGKNPEIKKIVEYLQ